MRILQGDINLFQSLCIAEFYEMKQVPAKNRNIYKILKVIQFHYS
jgi:hypothetical protein